MEWSGEVFYFIVFVIAHDSAWAGKGTLSGLKWNQHLQVVGKTFHKQTAGGRHIPEGAVTILKEPVWGLDKSWWLTGLNSLSTLAPLTFWAEKVILRADLHTANVQRRWPWAPPIDVSSHSPSLQQKCPQTWLKASQRARCAPGSKITPAEKLCES